MVMSTHWVWLGLYYIVAPADGLSVKKTNGLLSGHTLTFDSGPPSVQSLIRTPPETLRIHETDFIESPLTSPFEPVAQATL